MAHLRFNRAQRRHHYARLKQNRAHYWGGDTSWTTDARWLGRRAGTLARTPTPCSCHLCRSPRYSYGNGLAALTWQERRHRLAAKDWAKEVGLIQKDLEA